MKRLYKNVTILSILTGIGLAGLPLKSEPTNAVPELVQGNNAFALDLYAKLKSREGNLIFSPLSISTCLGMTYAGARGETEKQMAKVLHFGTNQPLVHAQFKQLLDDFAEKASGLPEGFTSKSKSTGDNINTNKPVLQESFQRVSDELPTHVKGELANAVYVQKGQTLLPGFQGVISESYHALLKQMDFRTDGVGACKEINEWIEGKTSGKIQKILQPGDLDDQTRMVLVNTLYFKGQWAFAFRPKLTTLQPFILARDASKEVSMMHIAEGFPYYEEENFQALQLYYADYQFSMLILLPRQQDDLKSLEAKLNAETLARLTSGMKGRHVDVSLPKFKLNFGVELSECLKAMGMDDVFSESNANFSGMDGTKDLYVSKAFHKAFAEVNEDGTEAAASSGFFMSNGMDLDPPIFSSRSSFYISHS